MLLLHRCGYVSRQVRLPANTSEDVNATLGPIMRPSAPAFKRVPVWTELPDLPVFGIGRSRCRVGNIYENCQHPKILVGRASAAGTQSKRARANGAGSPSKSYFEFRLRMRLCDGG